MKRAFWLPVGLILALLLVSIADLAPRFGYVDRSLSLKNFRQEIDNFYSGNFAKEISQTAAIGSTLKSIFDFIEPVTVWLGNRLLKLSNQDLSVITPTPIAPVTSLDDSDLINLREKIRQEILLELRDQSLFSTQTPALINYGAIVTPTTGSTTKDEQLKKSLQRIFADRVEIKLDPSGWSGVVTPVLADGQKGNNYIFVLIPWR